MNISAPTDERSIALLVAELNELLQLDYDAVAAYALALKALDHPVHREAVRRFKADHERHIEELTELVREFGGKPLPLPQISSGFKHAVHGAAADDAAVILAFKANEAVSRDRDRRAASRQHPADVQDVLIRGARDEQRHFDWVMRTLGELGLSTAGIADALEDMGPSRPRRRPTRNAGPLPILATGLIVVGVAAAVTVMVRRRYVS